MQKLFLALITVLALASCAPTRFVEPLAKDQQALNLSLGGPIIDYSDLPIPMPFLTATYGYGLEESLTGFASLNITSAIYGNLQTELGITKRLTKQAGNFPAISISPEINFIYRNKNAAKLYPQVDINAYWKYNKARNLFYAGLSNWFELASTRAFDEPQKNHWFLSPQLGEIFIRRRWSYSIEAKFIAPFISSDKGIVDYKTFYGAHGALGLYFGLTRKF